LNISLKFSRASQARLTSKFAFLMASNLILRFVGQILFIFQHRIPAVFQLRVLLDLTSTHFIDRFIEIFYQMKFVVNDFRPRQFFFRHCHKGLPHIHADRLNRFSLFHRKCCIYEILTRLFGAVLDHLQHPSTLGMT
jgi:hypothetical protein